MPADEVTHEADAGASRVRTGPRHAAPKKPLLTRFHVPAGKAMALAAMPTAVLMGMGLTPTLALADGNDPAANSKSLTAEEYQACVEALADEKDDASATPTPSASASESEDAQSPTDEPSPSATPQRDTDTGSFSSSDSGSDDKDDDQAATPDPEPSASKSASSASPAPSPSASASEKDGGLLEDIGDALEDILTGGHQDDEESPSPTAGPSEPASDATDDPATEAAEAAKKALEDATDAPEATGTASGTADGETDPAADGTQDGTTDEAADEATPSPDATASATPSPTPSGSASPSVDPEDCPAATDAEGGVDNTLALPDKPWTLEASSLLLKGASYKGVVEVRTASGATKKVLKYVVSHGTDIGDLHQTVQDERQNKTYHVQAAKGSTSTITDGETVMYTESISGNLLGLIPITFDPEHPPPLDIPLIYFTKVTVVQAGQFGGTLHIPGLHQYITG